MLSAPSLFTDASGLYLINLSHFSFYFLTTVQFRLIGASFYDLQKLLVFYFFDFSRGKRQTGLQRLGIHALLRGEFIVLLSYHIACQ